MGIRTRIKSIGSNALPEGYTRAEYLESTETPRINTKITEEAVVAYDIQFTNTQSRQIMGYNDDYNKWGLKNGFYSVATIPTTILPGSRDIIIFDNTKWIDDWNVDIFFSVNDVEQRAKAWSTKKGEWHIWGVHGDDYVCKARIWQNTYKRTDGTLLGYFIPALDPTGTPCMYDLVTRTPFKNDGTGNFLYKTVKYPFKPTDNFVSFKNKVKSTLPPELEYDISYDRENNILSIKVGNDITKDAIDIIQNYIDTLVEPDVTVNFEYMDGLPTRYTRLEYIENVVGGDTESASIILMDIYPTDKIHGEIVATACEASHTGPFFAFGSAAGVSSASLFSLRWRNYKKRQGGAFFMNNVELCTFYALDGEVLSIQFSKNEFVVNGNKIASFEGVEEFASPRRLMFMAQTDGRITARCFKGKAYSFKLWEGDKPLLNFIPALDSSGVPGMYDTVKNAFNKSATATPFVAGMTLQQVRDMKLDTPGSIPSISLSIPCEVYNDSEAWNVIKAAQQKGWTFTFYWTDVVNYLTPQLNDIIGSGNYTIAYDYQTSKLSLTFALSVTEEQIEEVNSLLERVLSSNIVKEM